MFRLLQTTIVFFTGQQSVKKNFFDARIMCLSAGRNFFERMISMVYFNKFTKKVNLSASNLTEIQVIMLYAGFYIHF